MRTAGTPDGTELEARAAPPGAHYRCPACGGGLVLRRGARLAPHFAHRPRQACARIPGPAATGRPPRSAVQLHLFEPPPPTPPRRTPTGPARWHQPALPLPTPAVPARPAGEDRRPAPARPPGAMVPAGPTHRGRRVRIRRRPAGARVTVRRPWWRRLRLRRSRPRPG